MEGVNCCMVKGKSESLPAWTKPVEINGIPVIALLDTGCTKSMVHPRCIQQSDYLPWEIACSTASACSTEFPVAMIVLKVKGGKEVEMAVGVSKHIKTDVILGHDVPHFQRYLSEAMKAETWETESITVKSDAIPPTPTTTEFALATTRGQERVQAQQEKESSTQQALDKPIIHTLEPSSSGCEVEGCPEDGAAEEGVNPRKEPNPSPNNKLSTPPLTKEENVDDLDEENDPGHEPPQESVADPELVLDSTNTLMGEQNIFDTISANQLKEEQLTDSSLEKIRVKAAQQNSPYFWKEKILMRKPYHVQGKDLIVVPKVARVKVLQLAHNLVIAGHFGLERTLEAVRRRMDWPGIVLDIKELCKSCPVCQRAKLAVVTRAPLHSLPIIANPFQRIAMDIFGPLARTKDGNKYILVIMDYATRWLEAYALKNCTADTVVNCLIDLCARVGIPQELLTDNGTNFISKVVKQF